MSTFKKEAKPERLQFFGSTVERFQEKQTNKKTNAELGPGCYEADQNKQAFLKNKARNQTAKTQANVGFASGQQRFDKEKEEVTNAF